LHWPRTGAGSGGCGKNCADEPTTYDLTANRPNRNPFGQEVSNEDQLTPDSEARTGLPEMQISEVSSDLHAAPRRLHRPNSQMRQMQKAHAHARASGLRV